MSNDEWQRVVWTDAWLNAEAVTMLGGELYAYYAERARLMYLVCGVKAIEGTTRLPNVEAYYF